MTKCFSCGAEIADNEVLYPMPVYDLDLENKKYTAMGRVMCWTCFSSIAGGMNGAIYMIRHRNIFCDRGRIKSPEETLDHKEVDAFTECDGAAARPEPELYAIITIKNGVVHLEHTVNPDASYCQDHPGSLQLETYSSSGWRVDKTDARLEEDFWGLWSELNGCMAGGIRLRDNYTFKRWDKYISKHKVVSPSDIKGLPDGEYAVYASIKES